MDGTTRTDERGLGDGPEVVPSSAAGPDGPGGPSEQTDRATTPRRRRRLTWRTALGLVLVLSGLSVLGYVGWEYYGTDIVSKQAQARIVDRTEQAWEEADAGAGAQSTEQGATLDQVPTGAAEALIRIPRFGDDYVMPVQAGVSDEVLAEGYGHFESSADAGGIGNYALAAHRVTHGEPLRRMPELRPGDEVVVTTRDEVFTYVLDTNPNDLVIGFENVWVTDPTPINPTGGVGPKRGESRLITLTTCAELFHTDERMIAFGHLVSTEPR